MVVNFQNSVDRPNFPAKYMRYRQKENKIINKFGQSGHPPEENFCKHTKCIIPAAVNQTDINMETS